MKPQIVNIVNFIRAVEPRLTVDLVTPVREQIRLMKEHHLRGTFLLQYDALVTPPYADLMKELDPSQFELGVWFEVVQPQCEAAGIPWTGRYPWDWHAHCGFSVGYTVPQKEVLVDVLYEKFRELFGYYPKVFGSWFFDTPTVRYIAGKYGVDALCNCKEQYGTDGYTLWGGYYGQAYYPSSANVFMPAQRKEKQLDAPLFRMLGSDPVRQYDFGMDAQNGAQEIQGVVTLEPVYNGGGGGIPAWVDWFLKENYNGDCLTFGYAQAGQENSFGWPGMKDGLTYQFGRFAELQKEGKLTAEPLGETGRRFKAAWDTTPPSAITAHTAFDDPDTSSVWYDTKYYRINLFRDKGEFRVRDLHLFDEDFPDPYESRVCEANDASYETLPFVDGNRYSGNGVVAGLWPQPAVSGPFSFTDLGEGNALVKVGAMEVTLKEDRVLFRMPNDFRLINRIGKDGNHLPETVSCTEKQLTLRYRGTEYAVTLAQGRFEDPRTVVSENGTAELILAKK